MFKKSKLKIIALVMLIMTLLLTSTVGIIYAVSYRNIYENNIKMLQAYCDLYAVNGNPKDNPLIAAPPDDLPDNPPPSLINPDSDGFIAATFYAVELTADETVVSVDNSKEAAISNDTLIAQAKQVLNNGKSSGRFGKYIYMVTEINGNMLVAFSDNTALEGSMKTLMKNTIVFGAFALILTFISAIFLSGKIIAPLEENDKNQKQFVSDAGHDLKTPISVISTNAELLKREIGDNQWLDNVIYENQKMFKLVQELMELSKNESADSEFVKTDFSRIALGEALAFESVAFENGKSIKYDKIESEIYIKGKEDGISRLCEILLDNAVSYSYDASIIEIQLHSYNNKAVLKVINDADAIPEEQQQHIFERFYRNTVAREDDGHYGLGLSIAKAIVEKHSGTISVDCKDKKVTFTVKIPIYK